MRITHSCLIAAATVSASLCLVPSASAGILGPKVKVNRVVPPPNDVSGIASVEVASFSGYGGDALQGGVREALLADSRGDYNPKHPTLNEGFAVSAFEVVTSGGDARVGGSVDIAEKVEDYETTRSKRDSEGNVIKDSEGKPVKEKVPCKKREVTASVQWSVTDSGDRVVVQESTTTHASDSKCGDDRGNLESRDALADAALASVPWAVANSFAPRWEVHVADLSKDKSVKEPLALAKDDNLTLAMCGFREITATDPYNVDAIYNLGVMLEVSGWYDAAAEQYTKGVSVNSDKNSSDGLSRVRSRQAQLASLTSMGQVWAESEPDFGACPELPAGRPVVVKKPADLLSAPELGSPALVSLPKGMKLYVTDEAGALYKVQTGDGAEGWIDPKLVK